MAAARLLFSIREARALVLEVLLQLHPLLLKLLVTLLCSSFSLACHSEPALMQHSAVVASLQR